MSNNAAAPEADPYALVPELGDYVTFLSDVYKSTTGHIIYRDMTLIRIRPFTSASTAIDFPLTAEGLFQESLGVSEIQIHEKRKYPHFSKQLSAVPGDMLEFFNTDGTLYGPPGIISEIIATANKDAIRLEDGTVIDFGFVGPKAPLQVLLAVAPPEAELPPENEAVAQLDAALEEEYDDFPEIDLMLLPMALVEEIPSEERTASDTVQREDMYISLLLTVPQKRQKDPKVMKELYRETDVLLALKNSVVERDSDGAVVPDAARSYTSETIAEALKKQPTGAPLSALIPVADVKKVLYINAEDAERENVVIRNEYRSLGEATRAEKVFESQAAINPFFGYMQTYMRAFEAYTPAGEVTKRIRIDQDVLRSRVPPEAVEGFINLAGTVEKKRGRGKTEEVTTQYIGSIEDRLVRLTGPTRMRRGVRGPDDDIVSDERNTIVVASGDSAETVGHVLLSPELAGFRSPIRSSVLLWDVHASEASRMRTRTFYKALMENWASQEVLGVEEERMLSEIIAGRLGKSLTIITLENTSVLDSVGLRNLELTDGVFQEIIKVNRETQKGWNAGFAALQERALTALEAKTGPVIPTIAAADSALFAESVIGAESFRQPFQYFQEKETSLKNHDLALTAAISGYAEKTFGQYWYSLVAGNSELIAKREAIFLAESGRQHRNTQTVRQRAKELTARPDINPCIHVHEFERVKGIRNDEQRMLLFEQFLKKFHAGQNGNTLLCGTCGKDMVCKHEQMLLQEFLHPGRGAAIHKTLLLEFAGPAFEGAYICKSCGQKIAELEYDTHLEFDDEGRPLVGRTIATEDADESDEVPVALREDAEAEIPFTGEDKSVYLITRTLFERAGIVANMDMYRRVVLAAQEYMRDPKRIIERKPYEERREKEVKAAKAGAKLPPEYESYFASRQIGVLGALLVLELQTTEVEVPFAASGCPFRRDGFPLDGETPAVGGSGALKYSACVAATILRNDKPWNKTSWTRETEMKKRSDQAEAAILVALNSLLCIRAGTASASAAPAPPVPLSTITDMYKTKLDSARKEKISAGLGGEEGLASYADRIPPSFRPLPRATAPSATDERPIGNAEQFLGTVGSAKISELVPMVSTRLAQVAQKAVGAFNEVAKATGIIPQQSIKSDSACCFSRLADIRARGFGIGAIGNEGLAEEARVLAIADRVIGKRDPIAPGAGTHIVVPWSAPLIETVLPEPDPNAYYKLFMKHCFVEGRNYGGVHEFNADLVCRNCRFQHPNELVYLTGSEIPETGSRGKAIEALFRRREQVSLDALASQGVEISDATFRNLQEAIRNKKMVASVEAVPQVEFMALIAVLEQPLTILTPAAVSDWRVLLVAMSKIQREGITTGPQRRRELGEFSRRYDALGPAIDTALRQYFGTTPSQLAKVAAVIEGVKKIVGNPENAVRNVLGAFVVRGEQIADEFSEKELNIFKWFPKANRSHIDDLEKIWKRSDRVVAEALTVMEDMSEGGQTAVKTALRRFTSWLGMTLAVWSNGIRIGQGFLAEEYGMVLGWTVYIGMLSLLTEGSPLYADIPSLDDKGQAVEFMARWFSETIGETVVEVKRFQLSKEQIDESLHARAELEKNFFIKKFDDLDKDLRKVELIKRNLKIGDWAVGTSKNLFSYNSDMWELRRDQRLAMGLPEFGEGEARGAAAERYGFFTMGGGEGEGYDHRAAQDED